VERPIDFSRDRHMLCGQCGRRWAVDLDSIDRWEEGKESCPGSSVACEAATASRVTVDPDDPSLNDEDVGRLTWYHTTAHPGLAELTQETRRSMGGDRRVREATALGWVLPYSPNPQR